MQAAVEDVIRMQVADDQGFLESRCFGDKAALLGNDQALPVENQFILTAHQVDVGQDHLVILGAHRQHPGTVAGAVHGIGRGRDIDDNLGIAVERLVAYRPAGIPNILANAYPDVDIVKAVDRQAAALLEIAVLIKHAVVGEVLLVIHIGQFLLMQQCRSIENVIPAVDEAGQNGDVLTVGQQFMEIIEILIDELRAQQQVLCRIAGQRHLWKCDDIALLRPSLLDIFYDFLKIPVDIPDRHIDLGQRQAE